VIVAGERTNEIFIENGRFHGALIANDIAAKFGKAPAQKLEKPQHTYAAE
jgi:thioredoxin reductase (NADPH)